MIKSSNQINYKTFSFTATEYLQFLTNTCMNKWMHEWMNEWTDCPWSPISVWLNESWFTKHTCSFIIWWTVYSVFILVCNRLLFWFPTHSFTHNPPPSVQVSYFGLGDRKPLKHSSHQYDGMCFGNGSIHTVLNLYVLVQLVETEQLMWQPLVKENSRAALIYCRLS